MNTAMMGSILCEQAQYTVDQINEFMNTIMNDLSQQPKKIQEFMKLINPTSNPQVYLWLIQAQVQNFANMHIDTNKNESIASGTRSQAN